MKGLIRGMEIISYFKGTLYFWQWNEKRISEDGSVLYICTPMEPEDRGRDHLPKAAFPMEV